MKVKHINDSNAPSYCNIPKKPLIEKKNQVQHISFATKVVSGKGGGVLRNKAANWRMEDRNLETKFWKTKLGRFTGFRFICGRDLGVGLKL